MYAWLPAIVYLTILLFPGIVINCIKIDTDLTEKEFFSLFGFIFYPFYYFSRDRFTLKNIVNVEEKVDPKKGIRYLLDLVSW